MNKIKKGDEVIVITGKDKGKKGTVLSIEADSNKLLVDGINIAKKHVKANPSTGDRGGIVDQPRPLHISNVKVYNASTNKGSRVGIRTLEDGQRVRYFKDNDQLVDIKG
jgi:large subunit ribosomal protein L24